MGFSGTTDKCKACDKTVHFFDMITTDGISYHKTCFKCSHCDGRLVMSNYSSLEGVLYCKPHFDQLFRQTGSYGKISPQTEKKNLLTKTPSKLSSMFSGTQDKCAKCSKTVYPLEKLSVEGEFYHKSCFRCAHGGCYLTPSTYAALDGVLYCKPHFAQLFKEKGCYNHLTRSASSKKTAKNAEEDKPEGREEETKDGEEESEAQTEEKAPVAQEQS